MMWKVAHDQNGWRTKHQQWDLVHEIATQTPVNVPGDRAWSTKDKGPWKDPPSEAMLSLKQRTALAKGDVVPKDLKVLR